MKTTSKVHNIFMGLYVVAMAIGLLGVALNNSFGVHEGFQSVGGLLNSMATILFVGGLLLLIYSKNRILLGKDTDSVIYGVLSIACCIGGFVILKLLD